MVSTKLLEAPPLSIHELGLSEGEADPDLVLEVLPGDAMCPFVSRHPTDEKKAPPRKRYIHLFTVLAVRERHGALASERDVEKQRPGELGSWWWWWGVVQES